MQVFKGGTMREFAEQLLKDKSIRLDFMYGIEEDLMKKVANDAIELVKKKDNSLTVSFYKKIQVNGSPSWIFTINNLDTNRNAKFLLKSDKYELS